MNIFIEKYEVVKQVALAELRDAFAVVVENANELQADTQYLFDRFRLFQNQCQDLL